MPTDWRRFTGPEVSVPYARYVPGATKTPDEQRAALLDSAGKRADGRPLNESRPLSVVRTGVVSQAKGSAYLELGNTKVICSVFAPREIPNKNEFSGLGQVYCEVKYAMFSCAHRRRPHAPEADERELSAALRRALEPAVMRHMFPNYQVDVMALILEQDGACLAATVTAAGLALVDAAVPMYDIVCATTLAVLDKHVFMDATEAEELACQYNVEDVDANHGVVTLAVTPAHDLICDLTLSGSMDSECVINAMDLLRRECIERIVPELHKCLLKSARNAIKMKRKENEHSREREQALSKSVKELTHKLNAV